MSALTQRCKALFGYMDQLVHRIPSVPRDILTTALLLYAAYWTSGILISHTGGENNSALVFVLAVVCISFFTTGYAYGITASIIGTFCINYFFMVPYSAFSLSHTGYPVAMLSMVAISCIVCALTSRVKQQAIEAVRREKNTKTLYEMNEKLNAEKAAIQLQSARETIRGNILRAVSHDLRTPLTAISGAASVLLSSEDILRSEKNASLANDIKADADALIVMVENLLSVTRIQDGTIPLKKREEMLEEVAGDAILTTRRRVPQLSCGSGAVRGYLIPTYGAHAHQAGDGQPAGERGPPLRQPVRHPAQSVPSGRVGSGGGPGPRQRTAPGGVSGRPVWPASVPRSERGFHPRDGHWSVCLSKHHQGPQRLFCRGQCPGGRSGDPLRPPP